jgi:hypothetical protein
MPNQNEQVCRNIFRILFAQLICLSFWSLLAQSGTVFVQRVRFGLDFNFFYRASVEWLHGANPYSLPLFFTPPPSILVGTLLSWMPVGIAAVAFFTINLVVIVWSVRACAHKLELSTECVNYLTGN